MSVSKPPTYTASRAMVAMEAGQASEAPSAPAYSAMRIFLVGKDATFLLDDLDNSVAGSGTCPVLRSAYGVLAKRQPARGARNREDVPPCNSFATQQSACKASFPGPAIFSPLLSLQPVTRPPGGCWQTPLAALRDHARECRPKLQTTGRVVPIAIAAALRDVARARAAGLLARELSIQKSCSKTSLLWSSSLTPPPGWQTHRNEVASALCEATATRPLHRSEDARRGTSGVVLTEEEECAGNGFVLDMALLWRDNISMIFTAEELRSGSQGVCKATLGGVACPVRQERAGLPSHPLGDYTRPTSGLISFTGTFRSDIHVSRSTAAYSTAAYGGSHAARLVGVGTKLVVSGMLPRTEASLSSTGDARSGAAWCYDVAQCYAFWVSAPGHAEAIVDYLRATCITDRHFMSAARTFRSTCAPASRQMKKRPGGVRGGSMCAERNAHAPTARQWPRLLASLRERRRGVSPAREELLQKAASCAAAYGATTLGETARMALQARGAMLGANSSLAHCRSSKMGTVSKNVGVEALEASLSHCNVSRDTNMPDESLRDLTWKVTGILAARARRKQHPTRANLPSSPANYCAAAVQRTGKQLGLPDIIPAMGAAPRSVAANVFSDTPKPRMRSNFREQECTSAPGISSDWTTFGIRQSVRIVSMCACISSFQLRPTGLDAEPETSMRCHIAYHALATLVIHKPGISCRESQLVVSGGQEQDSDWMWSETVVSCARS
ncbi:hypothetical protein AK812_SmicGene30892 [Symbiodinium microadriaticum]|uniref:Uncharacterized protein n=1 Tax=Symbiodinium microadriaticum TaxID=2951 RepID=A0A1Q9CY19_SYMMI|nr:hypothetical protein AK812_SmicGene30892 [Symbiodinium microadriaticum]